MPFEQKEETPLRNNSDPQGAMFDPEVSTGCCSISIKQLCNRGLIGRQRRRSFDEDMSLNAMRHHLRRCFERSASSRETNGGQSSTDGHSDPVRLPTLLALSKE